MCFHLSLSKKAVEVAARFKKKCDIPSATQQLMDDRYHVNGFDYPLYPVVTADDELQTYRWGLIPFWTKDMTEAKMLQPKTLNARSDTIFQRPSFREAIECKRCLIPATGYFEWRHEDKKKIPYYIYVKDESIFSFAGIYDNWTDKETGEIFHTFSIITTDANSLTDYIHNSQHRMPVILHQSDEEKWLDPSLEKPDIASLLSPFPADDMDAYIINNDFLKKAATDSSILSKVNTNTLFH